MMGGYDSNRGGRGGRGGGMHNNNFNNHLGAGNHNNAGGNQHFGGHNEMGVSPAGHHSMHSNMLHRQHSNLSTNSGPGSNMGTPRHNSGGLGGVNKLPQQQSVINARRYSIYIKNVPQDKNTMVEIDSFFSHFGEVVKVDRHLEK